MTQGPPLPPPSIDHLTSLTWLLVALNLEILNLNFPLTFGSKLADLEGYKFMYSAFEI